MGYRATTTHLTSCYHYLSSPRQIGWLHYLSLIARPSCRLWLCLICLSRKIEEHERTNRSRLALNLAGLNSQVNSNLPALPFFGRSAERFSNKSISQPTELKLYVNSLMLMAAELWSCGFLKAKAEGVKWTPGCVRACVMLNEESLHAPLKLPVWIPVWLFHRT